MPALLAIDTSGIQKFIFSSNRLRDVAAASDLVYWATSRTGALKKAGASAEAVIMAAGGNAMVEFRSPIEASNFNSAFTRLLWNRAPGIEAITVLMNYDTGQLARAAFEIRRELEGRKKRHKPNNPMLGLSVTASCAYTGEPAIASVQTRGPELISNRIDAIRRHAEQAKSASRTSPDDDRTFADALSHSRFTFCYPLNLDQMRSTGNYSLIAVVHVDGNRVGKHIADWMRRKIAEGIDDNTFRQELKEWSLALDLLARSALTSAIDRLKASADRDDKSKVALRDRVTANGLELFRNEDSGAYCLPIRPILAGGDDLTFVCDGRVALSCVERVLQSFDDSQLPHLGHVSACAGVAFIPAHAPFSAGYRLSESLCRSAKALASREESQCCLDWHIGLINPSLSIRSLRERQYTAPGLSLSLRPYRLGRSETDLGSWRWLQKALLGSGAGALRSPAWHQSKNKIKQLRDILPLGPKQVRSALDSWNISRKDISELELPGSLQDGFLEARTPLLDAIELVDDHVQLQ